jgi:hypothetical protein
LSILWPLRICQLLDNLTKKQRQWWWCDEGIDVDGLKELDPGLYTHDGIHVDDIMEHGPSPIHYELVPSLPLLSNHILSAFQQGHSSFLLSKSRQPMATLISIPTISANHLEVELDCTIHTIQLVWGDRNYTAMLTQVRRSVHLSALLITWFTWGDRLQRRYASDVAFCIVCFPLTVDNSDMN